MRPDANKRHGTTLIELMLSVSMISLLASLVVAGLSGAWSSARRVVCASNLRQVGIAIEAYANSSRSMLPPISQYHVWGGDGTGDDAPGKGWTEFLIADIRAASVPSYLRCPSFPEKNKVTTFLSARFLFLRGERSWNLGDIQNGSKFVLAGDCSRRGSYAPEFGTASRTEDDCDKDDGTANSLLFKRSAGGEIFHKKQNNVVFADGHSDGVSEDSVRNVTFHPRLIKTWAEIGAPSVSATNRQ